MVERCNREPQQAKKAIKWGLQNSVFSLTSKAVCIGGKLVKDLSNSQFNDIVLHAEVCWPKQNKDAKSVSAHTCPTFSLGHMMTGGKYSDIKIVCKGKQFSCHKVILAGQSTVFDRMFSDENNLEVRQGIVTIQDMDQDAMEAFLRFLYTGSFDDQMKKHARSLLTTGDKYDVKLLTALAEEELVNVTNAANAIDMLLLSNLHTIDKLKRKAMKVIITNFDIICKQPKWQELKDDGCDMVALIEVSAEAVKK